MEVIFSILVALFGIGFGIFMALQPEDAIALHDRGRYTQTEPTEEYIRLSIRTMVPAFVSDKIKKVSHNGNAEDDTVEQRCNRCEG